MTIRTREELVRALLDADGSEGVARLITELWDELEQHRSGSGDLKYVADRVMSEARMMEDFRRIVASDANRPSAEFIVFEERADGWKWVLVETLPKVTADEGITIGPVTSVVAHSFREWVTGEAAASACYLVRDANVRIDTGSHSLDEVLHRNA